MFNINIKRPQNATFPPPILPEDILPRLETLNRVFKSLKTPNSYILITSPENRRYFSGFIASDPMISESSGCLLIGQNKRYLLSDSRYVLAAAAEAPAFEFVLVNSSWGKVLDKILGPKDILWFEPLYLSVASYGDFTQNLKAKIRPLPLDLDDLRIVKSPKEVDLIKKALAITEEAIGLLFDSFVPGWTEAEAAFFLDTNFRALGGEGAAFETIVATGPNAALPHAIPSDRVIEAGEAVVIDCGARYQGYAADCTRTLIYGEPKDWQKEIYRTVREAQTLAIADLSPKVSGAMVDRIARDHIAKAGYGEFFNHSLGHGVGLAVHENPRLAFNDNRALPVGAVVTVEPGIYLPDKGGVRLEQLVLITESGALVLNEDDHFYDF
ncbi:MAG: aminopeptidase P family protein [Deltaproteobacteria bacterium]|nr:aminopeptidase P family protein [Deltaproteobacteria bacterium]